MNDYYNSRVRTRSQTEKRRIDEALHGIAESLSGRPIKREMTDEEVIKSAIIQILKYYHIKLPDIRLPEGIKSLSGLLDYCVHKCGLEYRDVRLDTEWYKDAYGIMIGRLKEDGTPVVLLPNRVKGYRSLNLKTGKYTKMGGNTTADIEPEAVCFYPMFPKESMTVSGFIGYILRQLSTSDIVLFFLLAAVGAMIVAAIPVIMTWIWQYHVQIGISRNILIVIGCIIVLAISLTGISLCTHQMKIRIGVKININAEASWMQRMLHMPLPFYRGFSASELAFRTEAAKQASGLLIESVFIAVTMFFNIIALMIMICQTQRFVLYACILVYLLFQLIFHILFVIRQSHDIGKRIELSSKTDGIFYQMINDIQRIRLSGAEAAMFTLWAGRYADNIEHVYRPSVYISGGRIINRAVVLFFEAVLFFFMAEQRIELPMFLLLSISAWLIEVFLEKLLGTVSAMSVLAVSFKLAKPIMSSQPEDNSAKEIMKRFLGYIEVSALSFRYGPKKPFVLKDITMEIAPGENAAIVGRTGSGKSTLVRLLTGMETPESGTVLIDYRDISNYDPSSLHSHFGLVTKDDRLTPGTLMYNILMNALDQTEETAWEAAETACIAEDIRNMPMGMNTPVLEHDIRFSAGQIQRLMIARAIAGKPNLLILDDATGALDSITVKRIFKSLAELKCTLIIVSHRLSEIKYADTIFCIDDGKVAEHGTYGELVGLNGVFCSLMKKQMKQRPLISADSAAAAGGDIGEPFGGQTRGI